MKRIPVIDLFAGPGGLGEGFSAYRSRRRQQVFEVVLSIESEPTAHATLLLRSFYRQFTYRKVPAEYFQCLRGEIKQARLFELYPAQAERALTQAWLAELGKVSETEVDRRITAALTGRADWLLLGGPPCQAHSIVGRVRMKGENPEKFEKDRRHFLYKEYLRIIERHQPPVFVMENVKGILSAEVGGDSIMSLILADFNRLRYSLHSFVSDQVSLDLFGEHADPSLFVIKSEDYGIPQSRHRVIILGVRAGVGGQVSQLRKSNESHSMWEAIKDLPKIRSRLSVKPDSGENWAAEIKTILEHRPLLKTIQHPKVRRKVKDCARKIKNGLTTGGEFVASGKKPKILRRWYYDPRIEGICNHSARAHIGSDLHRYLFASCFAKILARSPELRDFPKALLPNHKNVGKGVDEGFFDDRFRVQVEGRQSTTITAHMKKDGHYYIHPDPLQCRSLTVREAARLQTFPDNYFFAGPRTDQYQQVGNAVPPYLARQLADVVHGLFNAVSWSKVVLNNGSPRPGKKKLEHVPDQVAGHGA